MLNIFHRETGRVKIFNKYLSAACRKNDGNPIFVEICKCVSNSLIKFGIKQNDSFIDRKEKKSNNFKNHENKINSDNISNPRI